MRKSSLGGASTLHSVRRRGVDSSEAAGPCRKSPTRLECAHDQSRSKVSGGGRHNGPLLGFHGQTRAPCALLPLKDRRYEIHDPTTGEVRRVTSVQAAQTIADFATEFYRPFPPTAIKLFDMFKFAVQGQRREVVAILAFGLLGGLIGLAVPVGPTGRWWIP